MSYFSSFLSYVVSNIISCCSTTISFCSSISIFFLILSNPFLCSYVLLDLAQFIFSLFSCSSFVLTPTCLSWFLYRLSCSYFFIGFLLGFLLPLYIDISGIYLTSSFTYSFRSSLSCFGFIAFYSFLLFILFSFFSLLFDSESVVFCYLVFCRLLFVFYCSFGCVLFSFHGFLCFFVPCFFISVPFFGFLYYFFIFLFTYWVFSSSCSSFSSSFLFLYAIFPVFSSAPVLSHKDFQLRQLFISGKPVIGFFVSPSFYLQDNYISYYDLIQKTNFSGVPHDVWYVIFNESGYPSEPKLFCDECLSFNSFSLLEKTFLSSSYGNYKDSFYYKRLTCIRYLLLNYNYVRVGMFPFSDSRITSNIPRIYIFASSSLSLLTQSSPVLDHYFGDKVINPSLLLPKTVPNFPTIIYDSVVHSSIMSKDLIFYTEFSPNFSLPSLSPDDIDLVKTTAPTMVDSSVQTEDSSPRFSSESWEIINSFAISPSLISQVSINSSMPSQPANLFTDQGSSSGSSLFNMLSLEQLSILRRLSDKHWSFLNAFSHINLDSSLSSGAQNATVSSQLAISSLNQDLSLNASLAAQDSSVLPSNAEEDLAVLDSLVSSDFFLPDSSSSNILLPQESENLPLGQSLSPATAFDTHISDALRFLDPLLHPDRTAGSPSLNLELLDSFINDGLNSDRS